MPEERVPVRLILTIIGLVVLTILALLAVVALARVIALLVVAGFFTVVLNPAVDLLQVRAHMRRGLSTFIVFIVAFSVFGAMMYAFIRPVVDQVSHFIDAVPGYVEDAQNGKGAIGDLIERYNLTDYV